MALLFDEFIDSIEQQLDRYIDQGSDEDLFVSGYLHGHFSLALSEHLLADKKDPDELAQGVMVNLHKAFEQNELEEPDQQLVIKMWQQVLQSAK